MNEDWERIVREEFPEGLLPILDISSILLERFQEYCRARTHEMEIIDRLTQARIRSEGARRALDEAIKSFKYDTHNPRKF